MAERSERAPRHCETCGSPLAPDQRYCLTCGSRAGGRSPQFDSLLARMRRDRDAVSAGGEHPQPPALAPAAPRRTRILPGPRVSAVLVLGFLGFGVLLGDAGAGAGSPAGAMQALRVVEPKTAPAVTAGSGAAGASNSEPPEIQPEPAPAAEEPSSPTPESSSGGGQAGSSTESGSSASGGGSGGGSGQKSAGGGAKSKHTAAAKLTDVKHVFLIVLSDQPYAAVFGPEGQLPYVSHTLEAKGELLLQYEAIAHEQLPNGVALISGQGPTAQTAANCARYTKLEPASAGADEQVLGDGCVYPSSVQTLPGQLEAKHLTWRAYVQGIDEGAATPAACAHPAPGAEDPAFASGPYATYRNPFVYFEAITSSPACAADDVGLSQLHGDLAKAPASVPAFSYIAPDRCDDAGPVACSPGAATGPADASSLLAQLLSEITASKAYKQSGLIVITTDEAPSGGEFADSSSCCGQPPYPNLTSAWLRHGGGVVGALLLSPFVKGGTTDQQQYNHYSLLRTVEDIFGLGHIGYAALPGESSFSASLLNGHAKG